MDWGNAGMNNSPSNISCSFNIEKDDFVRAGQASSTIKKMLRQLGIDSSIIRRAAIATYEAEMNIVIHSEGGSITIRIFPGYILIIAEDTGPGIENVELAMQEGYSTAPDRIREMGFGAGMGLSNMKKCSDHFVIETERGLFTRVSMKICL
jgi:anti-sigma regulatory factor (Ser/Thr protein kinase)